MHTVTPTEDDGSVVDALTRVDPPMTASATAPYGNDAVTGQVPDSDAAVMSLTPWLYQVGIFFSNSLLDEPALLALIFT